MENFEQAKGEQLAKAEFVPSCDYCRNYSVCRLNKLNLSDTRTAMHDTLESAIVNDQMELYVQFVYSVKDGTFTGVEALSRWNHPIEGILPPAKYIKGMNFVGISDQLDYCILEKSCQLMEYLKKNGYGDFALSCNFTRSTISSPEFPDRVADILSRYEINRSRLTAEITEDTMLADTTLARENMLRCKELGISVALDDLGAGYSALRDLCDYPIDFVKIDRCITVRATTDKGFSVLKGFISMAHDMGMDVLCEGVETEEQREAVIKAGADYIQGFYYSHVLSMSEAHTFFRENILK